MEAGTGPVSHHAVGVIIVLDNEKNIPYLLIGSEKIIPVKPTSDDWYTWDPPETPGDAAPTAGSHDVVVDKDPGPYPGIIPED